MKKILFIFLCIFLAGCANSKQDVTDVSKNIADFDIVISSLQGRIETIEAENKELKKKIDFLNEQIDVINQNKDFFEKDNSSDKLSKTKLSEYQLKLFFKQLAGMVDDKLLDEIVDSNSCVYKSKLSPANSRYILWVEQDDIGDLYIVDISNIKVTDKKSSIKINKKIKFVGQFSKIGDIIWSPNSLYVIIEALNDNILTNNDSYAYVIDVENNKIIAGFEYSSEIFWNKKGDKFIYGAASENLFSKPGSIDMYSKGVYLYDTNNLKFSVIDSGDCTYSCISINVDDDSINYCRDFSDDSKSNIMVKFD